MPRRTSLLLLLLLLLAAVALHAWLGGSPPPAPAPPSPQQSAGAGDADTGEPAIDGPAGAIPPGTTTAPPTRLRAHVDVRIEERYLPPPLPSANVCDAATGEPLAATLLAGAGAALGDAAPAVGVALVAIDRGARGTLVRRCAVDPAAPPRLDVGADVAVSGLVLDAARRPVAGASVWFGEVGLDGARREVATDAEGRFLGQAAAGAGVPLVVRAAGHAAHGRFVEVQAAPAGVHEIVLAAAAPLVVSVIGPLQPEAPARVFVVPLASVSTELGSYPFFLQTLQRGAPVDAAGRVRFDDLPRDAEVGVVAVHALAPIGRPHAVTLRGRNEPVVLVLSTAPAAAAGAVVDDEGLPLGDATVVALPGRATLPAAGRRLLPTFVEANGACVAFADAAGAFRIGAPADAGEPGRWLVQAPLRAGRLVPAHDGGEPLRLPRWAGGALEIVLAPPVADEAWTASTNLGGGVTAAVGAGQPWRLALPHAGRFSFAVELFVDGVAAGRLLRLHVDATGPVALGSPGVR